MSALDKLETALDEVLDKKAPVKLPQAVRKGLAGALWWIALIFGVLELWAAYSLWHWGHLVNQAVDAANSFARYYGVSGTVESLGAFYYIALILVAIVAVLLLVATPALKAMRKSGWNLLFYAMLVEAVAAVARLFFNSSIGGGFGNFLMATLTAVVGAWLLFQVRDNFTLSKPVEHKPVTPTK